MSNPAPVRPAFYTPEGVVFFNKAISQSYFQLGLFFILAALFAYFIFKLVISMSSIYNDYLLMSRRVENQKVAIKIPGISDGNDDDIDYSNPLSDRHNPDHMNMNDNIEDQIEVLDDDVVNAKTGKMKNLIKMRKEQSKLNGPAYTYSAYIGNNIISAEFDDYVYAPPNNTERGFFEYLFNP